MELSGSLESRLERVENIDAIQCLMADYCHFCDVGWAGAGADADKVADLFADDGVWDSGFAGTTPSVGRSAIRDQFLAFIGGETLMSVHIAMTPSIKVDGNTANGAWYGFIPIVRQDAGAMWICGRYECNFSRLGSEWKIALLRFIPAFVTPYDEGFAKTRFLNS